MAGVRDADLLPVGPWPSGINNLAAEGRLPTDENGRPLALREADNVDLDRGGHASRRPGTQRFRPGALTHSLWSCGALDFGLFVDAGQLHVLRRDESAEPLGVQVGNLPLSYELVNDRILWTHRTGCGLLTLDLQPWAWAPDQPAGQPALAPAVGLALEAGQYQVAVTFTDGLGRESGSTLAAVIDVAAGQGIALSAIPQPADPAAVPIINLYVSAPNDKVLHLHSTLPVGTTSYLVGQQASGRSLHKRAQFLVPLPPGQFTAIHSGRQYVATGRYLRWSEPMRYGLALPENVIGFDTQIDLLTPVDGAGLFVADRARTYWLGGPDPKAFSMKIAGSAGALPGSAIRVPGNALGLDSTADVPMWIDRNGRFCVGAAGSITALKQDEAVIDSADRAAMLFRQGKGMQHIVAALRGPRRQGMAIGDTAVAHVIHDER